MARAMESRCFCPPDTLLPPWAMGLRKPSGLASIKSVAWAMAAASCTSPSVMAGPPNFRLDSMVPLNSTPFWGT